LLAQGLSPQPPQASLALPEKRRDRAHRPLAAGERSGQPWPNRHSGGPPVASPDPRAFQPRFVERQSKHRKVLMPPGVVRATPGSPLGPTLQAGGRRGSLPGRFSRPLQDSAAQARSLASNATLRGEKVRDRPGPAAPTLIVWIPWSREAEQIGLNTIGCNGAEVRSTRAEGLLLQVGPLCRWG